MKQRGIYERISPTGYAMWNLRGPRRKMHAGDRARQRSPIFRGLRIWSETEPAFAFLPPQEILCSEAQSYSFLAGLASVR